MRTAARLASILAIVAAFCWETRAQAQGNVQVWTGPLRHYGYTYYPPSGWAVPPPAYYPGSWYGGYYGRALPPYGFGSPYYNGYNDPYFYSYGPGVREFLLFGGADFYGW